MSLSLIVKPKGMVILSSILTPYCHISLPYVMDFAIMQTTIEDNSHPRNVPCVNM